MMKIRPFALLNNSLLRDIEGALGVVASAWSADWGVERLSIAVTCSRAWEVTPSSDQWSQRIAYDDKQVWLSSSPELLKYVQRQIFPIDKRHVIQAPGPTSMALDGAEAAIEALISAIAHKLGMSKAGRTPENDINPDPQNFARASGAVVVGVKVGEQSIKFLINHACVKTQRLQQDLTTLEPLKKVDMSRVCGTAPISLKVSAGQVEVDVGSFMTLAVGDVIRLETSIDKPLKVLGTDDQILFEGHLGTLNKSMAIEVVHYLK
jgi:flagellar motor switch/type III secretory pathway protein FliN